jgi:hypothetical protein
MANLHLLEFCFHNIHMPRSYLLDEVTFFREFHSPIKIFLYGFFFSVFFRRLRLYVDSICSMQMLNRQTHMESEKEEKTEMTHRSDCFFY